MEKLALAAVLPQLPVGTRRFGGFDRPAITVARQSGTSMQSKSDDDDPLIWIAAIAAQRDKGAFAALFGFYAPRVKGFLVRTGTAAEIAEEIAQEAMLLVWRKASLFDGSRASASTWIYTIARNLRIDRLRHERGVSADVLYDVLRCNEPEQPDEVFEGADAGDRMRAAMNGLPSEQLMVVRLSFFEDKPHADIARILNIPLGTVKSRLRLAMAKLREGLDDPS
jgi:RNA polymerase sigma-70 factor, ECF subfamily